MSNHSQLSYYSAGCSLFAVQLGTIVRPAFTIQLPSLIYQSCSQLKCCVPAGSGEGTNCFDQYIGQGEDLGCRLQII